MRRSQLLRVRRRGRLVSDLGEAFVLPEDYQYLENRRGCRAAGECGAQGLRNISELHPEALGKVADRPFGRFGRPRIDPAQLISELGEESRVFAGSAGLTPFGPATADAPQR